MVYLKPLICFNIKRLRIERGYSIRQFAKLVGVDEKQIRRIESETYSFTPTIATLEKIINKLDISIEEMFKPAEEK